jgi:hypothetical protein
VGRWTTFLFVNKQVRKKKDPTSMLAPSPITWTTLSSLKMELVEVWTLAHSSPKCLIINLLFTFGSKSNNNL